MSILFPLGLGFLGFGGYECATRGLTEHSALLLFFGVVNTLYTAVRMMTR